MRELHLHLSGTIDCQKFPRLFEVIRDRARDVDCCVVDFSDAGEVFDSGLAMLLVLRRWFGTTPDHVRLTNCRPDHVQRLCSAGLQELFTISLAQDRRDDLDAPPPRLERRWSERVEIRLEAMIFAGDVYVQSGYTRDVGLNGTYLAIDSPRLVPGSVVVLVLTRRGLSIGAACRVNAKVQNVDASGVGVSFCRFAPALLQLAPELIASPSIDTQAPETGYRSTG